MIRTGSTTISPSMRVAFPIALAGAALAWGASARPVLAQDPSDIVLLAPADVRAEWTAALQVELAPRGARVIPLEPPEGETPLLRDAEAQRLTRERGALAAARVEMDERGMTLRVIERDATSARVAPVASEADARTVALILVTLLDAPSAPRAIPIPPPPAPATVAYAAPPEPVELPPSMSDDDDDGEEPAADDAHRLRWSGRFGTGGFGLANDRRFIPGAMIRGGLGMRYGLFEAALLGDVALMVDTLDNLGTELQPLGRVCIEAGAAIPFSSAWTFHVAPRGCFGGAELRIGELDPFFGGGTFDQLGWLGAGGGYMALSVGLSSSARLYIRADVEYERLESAVDAGQVFTALSILMSFG